VNITQGVQRVRDQLDDVGKNKWPDDEIVRHFDEQARALYRLIFRSNREWSNIALHLKKADAKTIFKNTYEWRLPTWVERVVDVYERTDPGDESTQPNYSSYQWANPANIDPNRRIVKTDPTKRDGWTWEGNHTLRLWNRTSVPSITIFAQALPAPMFKGKVATTYADASGFYRPSTFMLGDQGVLEEGAYVNAYVQVSRTNTATSTNLGEIRRIVYSRANAIVSSARQYEFKVESNWLATLELNDVVETLLPLDDIHSRLLVLRVVNACAVKKFNFDLQKSIAAEMGEHLAEFLSYAEAPRDHAGPGWYKSGRGGSVRRWEQDGWQRPGWAGAV